MVRTKLPKQHCGPSPVIVKSSRRFVASFSNHGPGSGVIVVCQPPSHVWCGDIFSNISNVMLYTLPSPPCPSFAWLLSRFPKRNHCEAKLSLIEFFFLSSRQKNIFSVSKFTSTTTSETRVRVERKSRASVWRRSYFIFILRGYCSEFTFLCI